MLKISGNTEFKTRLSKGGVGVGGSRAGYGGSKLDGRRIDDNEVDGNEVRDDEVRTKVQKLSKSKNSSKSKKTKSSFLTPRARKVITKLRQTFIKALILHYFDSECYIQVETDVSGYGIDAVLS